jgi:phosphoglucosamine mutase
VTLRFGTDGVRGDADTELPPHLVVALGRAAARVLGSDRPFVVGRDTRVSGARLEADLAAGLAEEGAPVSPVGVLPTPGVAFLAARAGLPAAMISASHNPFTDNGIKLFAPGGRKLDGGVEGEIERAWRALAGAPTSAPTPEVVPVPDARDAYVEHLVDAIAGRRLEGLRVVLDCANGAASGVAPAVLERLGARVTVLHAAPDGRNINDACGSMHPAGLQAEVVARGADAGLALDGDADRVVAVDERGALVDGDRIIAIAAIDLHERGLLRHDTVAITVMSNLGVRRALEHAGIDVVETPVGDRNVLLALEQGDLSLGGEQSGHIVFRDLATTGDGTLTGVLLLDRVARAGSSLGALASVVEPVPQLLEAIRVDAPVDLSSPGLRAAIDAVGAELGSAGRVLVRASGTEPVVRLMVEAPTTEAARTALARLRDAVHAALGGPGDHPS